MFRVSGLAVLSTTTPPVMILPPFSGLRTAGPFGGVFMPHLEPLSDLGAIFRFEWEKLGRE